MKVISTILSSALILLSAGAPAACQTIASADVVTITKQDYDRLLERLAAQDARLGQLELKLTPAGSQASPGPAVPAAANTNQQPSAAPPSPPAAAVPASIDLSKSDSGMNMGGHTLELPGGGPNLTIRGFTDFDFGVGTDANPLIFPLGVAPHSGFQAGEFDLMFSSRLSERLSFMSEIVLGSDATNLFGVDIERYELTYRANKYLEASAGRYHTSIGYYNTAFHHGTWFQTATGRPFMYFFEDSGGILPVHSVGVTATGLVPGTENNFDLHWIAEMGNGRASDKSAEEPVQNFYTDRNHKNMNFAFYAKPKWVPGLQAGGSYYNDRLAPPGLPAVGQNIESAYAVYITPTWEFLNEGVLLTNHVGDGGRVFHTPTVYTQISRKIHSYRPYFRYQYLNSPSGDPVNVYTKLYMGPSVGLRYDFSDYAAFKVQYNRLYQSNLPASNGLDTQIAFTF